MPLATTSSQSSAQKRAEHQSVENERRHQQQQRRSSRTTAAQRSSSSSCGGNDNNPNTTKRRTSLPSTAPSSTIATREKVERRRSLRHHQNNNKPPRMMAAAKENDNLSSTSSYEPPETRSAKKKKLCESFFNSTTTSGGGGMVLNFSPPDQAENERREKERIEREEADRARRVEQARLNGQLLVFSPSNNPLANNSSIAGSGNSSDATSHLTESVDDDKAASSSKQEEMLQKLQENVSILVEGQNRERRLSDADLLNQVQQMVQSNTEVAAISKLEETNAKLHKDLKEVNNTLALSKESFAAEKTRLEMQLENTQRNFHQLEQLRDTLEQQTATLEQDKSQLVTTVNTLEQDLADAKERLEEHQTSIQNLQQEYELEKEALTLGQEQLAAANRGLQVELENVQSSNDALERKIADCSSAIEQYESVTVPELQSQVQKERDAMKELEEMLQSRTVELEECRATIEQLKDDIKELKAKNEEERQSFQSLNENSHSAFEKMTAQAEEKDEQITKLTEQLEEHRTKLQTERDNMTASNETLRLANERLNAEQKQLNDALEETMMQLDQSERDKKALEAKLMKCLKQVEEAQSAVEAKESETAELIEGFVTQVANERQRREAAEQRQAAAEEYRQEAERCAKQKELQATDSEQQLKATLQERDVARNNMQGFNEREEELYRKLRESDRIRREMHSRIMQLMGNIRVFVRVRPALPGEEEQAAELQQQQKRAAAAANKNDDNGKKRKRGGEDDSNKDGGSPFRFPGVYDRSDKKQHSGTTTTADDLTKNLIEVQEPYKDRGGLKDRRKKWRFGFDHVFSPEQGQSEVWEATEPLIQSAVDGFNVTVFAYGQTGSGKTYTMLGGEDGNDGLIGRAVRKMFEEKREIEDLSRGESQVSLSVELLEVYNEKVRDLLSNDNKDQDLKVTSNEVVGNIVVETTTEDAVMKVLGFAQANRCVKATKSNAESSRSHMIFTLHFNVTAKNGVTRSGKLNVCDLAGSERLAKSGAHIVGGALLEESKNINKSLSTLSNVIERLQAGDKNVPFRESKLTYLLKNSLSGNSKTLAIICCNPLAAHVQESLCSLRFAEKVNRVDLKAVANFSC